MSSGPHVWTFFPLRTLVRLLQHFPACFRASYMACQSLVAASRAKCTIPKGCLGWMKAGGLCGERGVVRDRLPPAARDASSTQTKSKQSQRRQHIAASQTMLTANTHAAHCYLYHMPCIKNMLHLRRASPRHRDWDGGRRGRRGAACGRAAPAQPTPVMPQGILPVEFNGARKAPPANEALPLFLAFAQPGVSKARLMLSFNMSGDAQAALTGGEAERRRALAGTRRLRAAVVTAAPGACA